MSSDDDTLKKIRDAESTIKSPIPVPEAVVVFPSGDPSPSVLAEEEKKCDSTPQPSETRVKPSTSMSSPVREKRYPSRMRKAPQKLDL